MLQGFYQFASKESNTIVVLRKNPSLLERIKTPMYTLFFTPVNVERFRGHLALIEYMQYIVKSNRWQ